MVFIRSYPFGIRYPSCIHFNMGNVFTSKTQKHIVETHATKHQSSSPKNKSAKKLVSKMRKLQLDESMPDTENLPFQIFSYKQFIKKGNTNSASIYQSKLALTEGIIKTHNCFEELNMSIMPPDGIVDNPERVDEENNQSITLVADDLQRVSGENQKLSEYRAKLILHLREIEKSKRKKKTNTKRLMNKFGKSARSSVKILVGKRKNVPSRKN